jgi:hypothetical protein
MKKSQSITLTVLASVGIAAHAQQGPAAPAAPVVSQSCEQRRQAAKAAGTPAETCGHSTAHATSRGGFGATGKGHSSGG